MAKKIKEPTQETSTQRLSGLIKSCRDIMRKDKGMSGDADRLPMLTWIMFLKFLDDVEQAQEMKAMLKREAYLPTIDAPYRWRDWAKNTVLSGDSLLNFIQNERCLMLDGTEAQGLFPYLRSLQSEAGKGRKDVVATAFKGINNRMINGYLLRDVIDKIDAIQFNSTEEMFTLSHLYESILKEMRDASGDAGEFYTPRPVVKFMVEMLNPVLGEKVLDPASGTGGFLVESFEHLRRQVQTTEQQEVLQKQSIYGGEAKPLPYLLCQMNLLLHGLEFPDIDGGNSLRFKLTEMSDTERVDIILTNPPFGGEEERAVLGNFPDDMRTAETALLFLQLIMRKLKRSVGKAAVVVPNGTLFADGIAARIKEMMLRDFCLHTIVRLPDGVFEPYTGIPANLLFFEARNEQNKDNQTVWFYEILPPVGKKKYNKTAPMQYEEFEGIKAWWHDRQETKNAWAISISDILQYDAQGKLLSANLDRKNPNKRTEAEYLAPEVALEKLMQQEKQIYQLMQDINTLITGQEAVKKS